MKKINKDLLTAAVGGILLISIMVMGYKIAAECGCSKSPIAGTKVTIEMLSTAIECYRMQTGDIPPSLNDNYLGLSNYLDVKKMKENGLIKDDKLLDAWGTPLKFQIKGKRVLMTSSGENRKFDTMGSPEDDDIRNYE